MDRFVVRYGPSGERVAVSAEVAGSVMRQVNVSAGAPSWITFSDVDDQPFALWSAHVVAIEPGTIP